MIHLEIGELAVRGGAPGDAATAAEAFRRELGRLMARPGIAARLAANGPCDALRLRADHAHGPRQAGVEAARALVRALEAGR
jgi:hypothetical protein